MERKLETIRRYSYTLTADEVRQAIHEWLDEHCSYCVPIGVPLEVSEQGATLVWDVSE